MPCNKFTTSQHHKHQAQINYPLSLRMNTYNKIRVVCPSNMVTGGPEALHQLVNYMCNIGLPACIVYLPFDKAASTPAAYLKYNAPIEMYQDKQGELIIFPEIYPMLALKVQHAKAAMWWLSLDNFLERKNVNCIRDHYHYARAVLRGKKPLRKGKALKTLTHFSATHYASQYLMSCGISSVPLNDPVNDVFLNVDYQSHRHNKKNIILFNPTKGKKITKELISRYPQYDFLALKGFSNIELSKILFSAKLYIDFGHFPGGERMPREAAIHGCCVISGKLGSAGNEIDFPIPHQYKLDTESHSFIGDFGVLSQDIFNNFDAHYQAFSVFRNYLKETPALFKQQIIEYFGPGLT